MKKEDLIKLGLDEATAQKVADASNEELKGFIPKTRFDEVNDTKKQLEKDIIARDKQLDDLKKVDAEALKAEIEKLQGENKLAKEKFESDLKQMLKDTAIEKALINAKAKNIKAVKALLDLEKIQLDGENLKGMDEQITVLTGDDSSKFMFGDQTVMKGIKPGETSQKDQVVKNPWSKENWNLTEQGRIWTEDQELAKQLSIIKN